MKKIFFILSFILLLFILMSCNNEISKTTEKFEFTGSSNNWKASYTQTYKVDRYKDKDGKLKYHNSFTQVFLLEYIGDDIDSVGKVSYELKGLGSSSKSTGEILVDGKIKNETSGENGSLPLEDEEYNLIVIWNGMEEVFKIKGK